MDKFHLLINYISNIMLSMRDVNDVQQRWQLAFGTLLYFIRDKELKYPYEQDIDISMFYDDGIDTAKLIRFFESHQLRMTKHIKDDVHNRTLYLSFYPEKDLLNRLPACGIDIFFWYKYDNYYYHTYGEDKIFKGIPCSYLDGKEWKYLWWEDGLPIYLPHNYGACLDYWYPDWYTKRKNFGTSKSKRIVRLKSIRDFPKTKDQMIKSAEEYEQFKKELIRHSA